MNGTPLRLTGLYTNYRRNRVFHAVLCFAALCGQMTVAAVQDHPTLIPMTAGHPSADARIPASPRRRWSVRTRDPRTRDSRTWDPVPGTPYLGRAPPPDQVSGAGAGSVVGGG